MPDRRPLNRVLGAWALTSAMSVTALAAGMAMTAHPAGADSAVRVTASVDGKPIGGSNDRHPVRLHPGRISTVTIQIANGSDRAVDVRTVRLEGRVIGLAFYAYDTSVGIHVAAGATEQRKFVLDLGGLRGQAVGLIPGSLQVLDAKRNVVARQSLVSDVRGSLWSVYGVFGLAIAIMTALALVRASLEVAGHRSSPNRWWRGVRFGVPGIGVGLVAVFTLSATRLFAPNPGRWVPIVGVAAVAGFVLGYLTPTPDEVEEDEEVDDGVVIDLDSEAAAARPTVAPRGVDVVG